MLRPYLPVYMRLVSYPMFSRPICDVVRRPSSIPPCRIAPDVTAGTIEIGFSAEDLVEIVALPDTCDTGAT